MNCELWPTLHKHSTQTLSPSSRLWTSDRQWTNGGRGSSLEAISGRGMRRECDASVGEGRSRHFLK